MRFIVRAFFIGWVLAALSHSAVAQLSAELEDMVRIPAVSGYEQELASHLGEELKSFSPKTDNLGNVYVTLGSGAPHRLIVTAMDEPGYIVSAITPDGYLRVQRLPQRAPHGVFDLLNAAQPVWVMTRSGKKIDGVFAGLSVHLQPGRQDVPKMGHPDEMYVDVGARSAEEAELAGIHLLDPVALNRHLLGVGEGSEAGVAVGDRFGCAALVTLLKSLRVPTVRGTVTVAFVTQQWTGGRGLDRLLNEVSPDEMIYVGRVMPPGAAADSASTYTFPATGSGVLLAATDASAPLSDFSSELKHLSEQHQVKLTIVQAALPRISSYAKASVFPKRFLQIGVATQWPVTPAELISDEDLRSLAELLEDYVQAGSVKAEQNNNHPYDLILTSSGGALSALVPMYGASGHESGVKNAIQKMLPQWAKPETDTAGNLVLRLGSATPATRMKRIVFVAHMDEIGYEVKSVEQDGRLLVDVLGGGYTEYFLGHQVLVHTTKRKIGGVLELPEGWDKPGFEWPHGPNAMDEPSHVFVGTHSAEETQKLGIKPGDWVTIPKEYRPLLGTRANGRSFDDRVGCAALVEAVRALQPQLPGREVTFIWSTREEVGLEGAAAAAERMAKEGTTPDFVFAIDTFVSSDSPIEAKRFAYAELGKGFVVRAVDNSNITPREYVDRVVKLARDNKIPVQFGVTGGGNDGSVFSRYGSVDIPLGWPLRYSHSPAEVIDTRDADALAKIIAVLAKEW